MLLIVGAFLVVGLLLSARFFAGFYVDFLWHDSVGRSDVFWGVLRAKLTMFVLFAGTFILIAVLNLLIADRLAPSSFSANTHPVVERFHEFFGRRLRLFRIAVAVVVGLIFAAPAIGHWQDWMMFTNSKSFGISDAQFHHDIGFYLFRLPFITFVLDWLFAATIFVTILVVFTHVLNGGIVVSPPRPKLRRATKAHLAVLLAVLAVIKAGDYWVTRWELTSENVGVVRGPTYQTVNAKLPAVILLALIAMLVAGLFLSTLKTGSWRYPVVASALWALMALVAGVIYPAAVQALVVNPNQRDREAQYIARNIEATRHALGIDNVEVQQVSFGTLTARTVADDIDPLKNVRLLSPDPETMKPRFNADKGSSAGLVINDLDVDRYTLDGREQQVLVAALELDLDTIANKSWQGKHLISTHGCGLVMAPAGKVEADGRPAYEGVQLTRPELYFSDDISGYAIVNTSVAEDACGNSASAPYSGDGGVKLDSTVRRLAYALSYLDYNLFGSSAVTDESRLMSNRRVQDRVRTLAPFLSFDGDPYPVELDGSVVWVVDGYTTSDRYPYGQNADRGQLEDTTGLTHPFNYVRNSVKATVDAYTGAVHFYVVDEVDPVLKVWQSAFPDLFEPQSAMPAGLSDHLRYPEDLFRIQTSAYTKYHLPPEKFFDRDGAWSVAQASSKVPQTNLNSSDSTTGTTQPADAAASNNDFTSESSAKRFVPYYSMFRAPGQTEATFQMFRPFVPFTPDDKRLELQAFMTASSDPRSYGKLVAYEFDTLANDGPAKVASTMQTSTDVSAQIAQLNRDSQVIFGDLQMVPIDGSALWVRPLYVQINEAGQPTFRLVLVYYNGAAVFGTSLENALAKLFPGFNADIGDVVDGSTPDPGTPTPGNDDKTAGELLQEAQDLFTEADVALKAGDLGLYAQKIAAARLLVDQAFELLDKQPT